MKVRHIFERYHHSYYSWIVREARKNLLYTGNLDGAKTTSSFPTKLLSYKFLIGGLVTQQTKLTNKAHFIHFIYLFIFNVKLCSLRRFTQHLFVNHSYFISIMIGGTFLSYVTLLSENNLFITLIRNSMTKMQIKVLITTVLRSNIQSCIHDISKHCKICIW